MSGPPLVPERDIWGLVERGEVEKVKELVSRLPYLAGKHGRNEEETILHVAAVEVRCN